LDFIFTFEIPMLDLQGQQKNKFGLLFILLDYVLNELEGLYLHLMDRMGSFLPDPYSHAGNVFAHEKF